LQQTFENSVSSQFLGFQRL